MSKNQTFILLATFVICFTLFLIAIPHMEETGKKESLVNDVVSGGEISLKLGEGKGPLYYSGVIGKNAIMITYVKYQMNGNTVSIPIVVDPFVGNIEIRGEKFFVKEWGNYHLVLVKK